MPAPEEHARQRQRIARTAAQAAAVRWAQVDPANIARSWAARLPEVTAILTAAQFAAADEAEDYLDDYAEPADVRIRPAAFAGTASDGGGLASLLYQPAIGALTSIGSGAGVTRALAGGGASLDMIVRTQVADAGRLGDQIALTARTQVQGYVRQIVGATCARCTILAGRFYRWNAGFQRHPRCLPPGVVVSGPERLATTRRWFKGELRVIRTAGGQELPITGNHPVLTDQGWIPANLVQPGDNLVRSEFGHDARPLVVPDKYEAPAKVEDLWCPDRMLALRSVPTTPEDFHGDGLHGEVDVVLPDGLLGYRGLVPGLKPAAEALLRRGVEAATGLSGDGPPHQVVEGLLAAANGVMRRFRLVESVARGHLAGAYGPSLGHGPDLDAGQFETTPDHVTAQAVAKGERIFTSACNVLGYDLWRDEDLSPRWDAPAGPFSVETRGAYAGIGVDLLRRFAGQVHLDRVVENVTTQWAGHVYNLTSSEGWYSANGLIVSNCDCTHVPANREQWRQSARFHDPRQVYDSLSVAERQRAGWSLADQRAIAEGADLIRVTNMRGVTSTGTRRSLGRLTPDQIYRQAGNSRDEAIGLLRANGYLQGAPVIRRVPRTVDERFAAAATDRAALRAAPANAGRREAGNVTVTRSEQASLRDYISNFFTAINGNLRRGSVSEFLGRTVDRIDAVMTRSALRRDVLVWRGMQDAGRLFGDRLGGNLAGFEWRELGYVSTSANRAVARQFMVDNGSRVLMRVLVPRGTQAVQLSPWSEFAFGSQSELLLRRGLRLRVVRDRGVSSQGYRLVDVEVVPG